MISVIVCSIDPAKLAAVEASYARQLGRCRYEFIAIRDATSLCDGYGRGLARARGDVCVFSHDDIELLGKDLGSRLERHLASCDVVGVAGTTGLAGMGWAESGIRRARGMIAHVIDGGYVVRLFGAESRLMLAIEALDGVFFAARREVAERIGFDAVTFDGWHGYDTDFTFRCHLAGFRIAVCLDIPLIHFSNGNVDRHWLRYSERFAAKHARNLGAAPGKWLEIRRYVRTVDEVRASYDDHDALRALTAKAALAAGSGSA